MDELRNGSYGSFKARVQHLLHLPPPDLDEEQLRSLGLMAVNMAPTLLDNMRAWAKAGNAAARYVVDGPDRNEQVRVVFCGWHLTDGIAVSGATVGQVLRRRNGSALRRSRCAQGLCTNFATRSLRPVRAGPGAGRSDAKRLAEAGRQRTARAQINTLLCMGTHIRYTHAFLF